MVRSGKNVGSHGENQNASDGHIVQDNVAGVFANDLLQSLILAIGFKLDGEHISPLLVQHLEPLHEAGFLIHFNGSSVVQRPITAVVSGDAPFHRILERTTYYASVKNEMGSIRGNRFSQNQLAEVHHQVKTAHKHGLKMRYWGTPSWPRGLRNHIWHILVREGVDVIDVDDLRNAT
ncbi:hypothetical protein N7451_012139 [Penicillium sp. IBT 35674x]|nr:hypothetical protein N7451_012139 [Penicillium sp. IBT 35674x]